MTDIQIASFIICAETGSISKASEKIFCAPQSISKNLLNMEHELNCKLFVRTQQGIRLTEIGREYYNYFKSYNQQLSITLNTIQYMYEAMRLNFTLGISNYIDPYGRLFSSFLSFQEMHPETEFKYLQLENTDLLKSIKNKEIDLAIMCGSQISNHTTYQVHAFADEDLHLFISERLIDSNADSYMLFDSAYSAWDMQHWDIIAGRLANKHINATPKRLVHLPNLKSTISNVENGSGMGVCDANYGFMNTNTPGTHSISIDMHSSLVCVWDKKNENPLVNEMFLHLKSECNK